MGTERTGPDLTDVGTRQPSLDWNLVHLYNPRIVVKESIMPAFPFLFSYKDYPSENDVVVSVPAAFMKDKAGKIIAASDALDLIAYIQSLAPVNFDLDTRKLVDGEHTIKIVSKDPLGKEGIRVIPFIVRNGPAIAIEGISENDVVDGILSIMVNAYGKGDQRSFLISGSETPQSIPSWVWIIIIVFVAWALYYCVRYLISPG